MRALIVCLDNLGDLVFSTMLAEALQRNDERTQIDLFCKEYAVGVARYYPHVKKIYAADPPWDRAPGRRRGSWWKFVQKLKEIRRARYDLCVCVSSATGVAWAVALMNASKVVIRTKRKNGFLFSHAFEPLGHETHVLEDFSRLLRPLDIQISDKRYLLNKNLLLQDLQSRGLFKTPNQLDRTILIHPFAGHPRRAIPIKEWVKCAKVLIDAGYRLHWLGTGRELDKLRSESECDAGLLQASTFSDHEFGGNFELNIGAFFGSKLYVGHDSGPLHVANALGAKVFGFYIGNPPTRTKPQGQAAAGFCYASDPSSIGFGTMHELILGFMKGG